MPLTKELIQENFYYDAEQGRLFRKDTSRYPTTGCLHQGYRWIRLYVDGKSRKYNEARLVFFLHHGYFPEMVDHINLVRDDNRIENLRETDRSGNMRNISVKKSNKLGIKNVYQHGNKYVVCVRHQGENRYLGSFEDLEFADLVATEARDLYHGSFARG